MSYARDDGYVSIWAGSMSREELTAYLEEHCAEADDDDMPFSPFAAEFGIRYYDHDFLEAHRSAREAPLLDLLGPHSYSSSFAAAAAQDARDERYSVTILLFRFRYVPDDAPTGQAARVRFIGSYPYDRRAAPLREPTADDFR